MVGQGIGLLCWIHRQACNKTESGAQAARLCPIPSPHLPHVCSHTSSHTLSHTRAAQLAKLVVQHDIAVTRAARVHHDNKGLQAGLREAQARAEEAEAREQAAQGKVQGAERRALEADRRAAAAEARAAAASSRWAGHADGVGAMLGVHDRKYGAPHKCHT